MSDDAKEAKLTNKQRAFIDEYLLDFNATRAARKAGYSEKTAYSIGSRLLRKPYIVEEINRRLANGRDRRTSKKNKPNHIYLIREDAYGLVKIGIANNPMSRLSNLQVSCPQNITLIAVLEVENARIYEAELHSRYRDKHYRGEWFRLLDEDIEDILKEWKNYLQSIENSSTNISHVLMQPTLI